MTDMSNIRTLLAEEAEASERGRDLDAPYARNRTKAKDPSQVYSVRLPVNRLEELRQVAARQHVTPSALLRRWAIERLDAELERPAPRSAIADDQLQAIIEGAAVTFSEKLRERLTEEPDPQ